MFAKDERTKYIAYKKALRNEYEFFLMFKPIF